MKQIFGLFLLSVIVISNLSIVNSQFSLLDKLFTIQGHNLDCVNRCSKCIDENSFNIVHKTYLKTLADPVKDLDIKKLNELLIKKAEELGKSKRLVGTDSEEKTNDGLSDEEKIKSEVAKSENELDEEVKVAVNKVIKSEGESNAEKIRDIASRVRGRMVEKYRKEAARKLGIDLDSVDQKKKNLKKAERKATTLSSNLFKNKYRQKAADTGKLYRIYFKICINSGSVFYSSPIEQQ